MIEYKIRLIAIDKPSRNFNKAATRLYKLYKKYLAKLMYEQLKELSNE